MEKSFESAIPSDLWRSIGFKLDTPADRLRFRAVCKSWMSLVPFRQPPWLMLAEAEADDHSAPPGRGFVCLGDQKIYRFELPEIHQAKCIGSRGNWLASVHLDMSIRLLNPFSRLQFHLPPVSTFEYNLYCDPDEELSPEEHRDNLVRKIVISPDNPPDCVAVALHSHFRMLAIARPGDASWTTVHIDAMPIQAAIGVEDMIFYNSQCYVVTFQSRLMLCDIDPGNGAPPRLSYLTDPISIATPEQKKYLVELSGDLLLVIKFMDTYFDAPPYYAVNRFEVYKFDSSALKFDRLDNLGPHSLFLGFNTSVAVLASDYFGFVRSNCIYFTDDYTIGYRGTETEGGHSMGVFDLKDNTLTPHYEGVSTSLYSPPLWIVPPVWQ